MENDSSDSLATGSPQDSLEGPPAASAPKTPPPAGEPTPSLSSNNKDGTSQKPPEPPRQPKKRLHGLIARLNVYLFSFGLVLVLGIAVVVVAYHQSGKSAATANLSSKGLSATTLAQLANSDATVGSTGQLLNIQSSAVFAGQVLVRQDLDVAGNLQIGGTLSLNDLTVAGTSQLGQAQVNKDLAVAGNTSLQGGATIAKSLQVSGSGTFSGALSAPQLTTSTLQLNGDLTLTHHITAGGATPSRTNGSALGSGGSSSVSGSDTAGSITINTGGSPSTGCFITINFTAKYNATPHVLVTPIGAGAGALSYYVNRSASSFSVCDAAAAPAGSSFGFDYFVID